MASFKQIEQDDSNNLNEYSLEVKDTLVVVPKETTPTDSATTAASSWIPATGSTGPAERIDVDDLALLSELTHPVRSSIMRRLKEPRTVAEVAAILDVPVTRLYHHVNRLERLGLIRVVATRQVAAVTERRYQVAATNFGVARELIESENPADVAAALGSLFDLAKFGLQREIENGSFLISEHDTILSMGDVVLSPARRRELIERLAAIFSEFTTDATEDDPDATRLTLFVSAIPNTT